jgi:hypothetical protein
MKIILFLFSTTLCGSYLNAQVRKYPFKMDSIPKFKPQTKTFTPNTIPSLSEEFVQKQSNNLKNTGKKTSKGFDIYVAETDRMSVLIPNTQNPNYIDNKLNNTLEFKKIDK